MAGRGRGAVLPAWMTSSDSASNLSALAVPIPDLPKEQFADVRGRNSNPVGTRDQERRGDREEFSRRDRSRSRDKDVAPVKYRSKSPSAEKEPVRESKSSSGTWVSRKGVKKSNFDVPPAPGSVPAFPIPSQPLTGNSTTTVVSTSMMSPAEAAVHAQTKHARRLYVGGVPANTTDAEIISFFTEIIPDVWPGGPVGLYESREVLCVCGSQFGGSSHCVHGAGWRYICSPERVHCGAGAEAERLPTGASPTQP